MTKFILLYILVFIFIPIIGISGENADKESSVVRVENNLLTVQVRDIPLKKVLTEISNQTQIKFVFLAPAEEPFLTSFSRLPMENGLKRLLADYNYSIIFSSEESKEGGHKIKQVFIVSKEGESLHRNVETIIVSTEASEPEPMSDEMLYEMEREEMERRRRLDEEEEDENETTAASYSNEFQRENTGGRIQVPEEVLTDEEEEERELREREERERLDDEIIANETTAASFGDEFPGENAGGRLSNEEAIRMTSGGRTQRHKRIQTDISDEEREEIEMRRRLDDEEDEEEEEEEQYGGH